MCCSSQKDKGTNPENLPKSKVISKIEKLLTQEFLQFFFFFVLEIFMRIPRLMLQAYALRWREINKTIYEVKM
jgi:hypothetical protein